METLIAPATNLLILIFILAYYLRKPLKDFVSNRHFTVANELKNAQNALAGARAKYDEFEAKLKFMDKEVAALREQSKGEAAQTKERIVAQAKKLADNIVTDANAASLTLVGELRGELYDELGRSVVRRAEVIILENMTAEDRARIRQNFVQQVGASR